MRFWLRVLKTAVVLLAILAAVIAEPLLEERFSGTSSQSAAPSGIRSNAAAQDAGIDGRGSGEWTLSTGAERKDLSDYDSIGTIFIGDSRFVGMDTACNIDGRNDEYVVAETGEGLMWLKNTGMKQAREIRRKHKEYDAIRYVICLGINDLVDADDYVTYYQSLDEADDPACEIVLVSVNPVRSRPDLDNDDIEDFNDSIAGAGFFFIDTYTVLMEEGYTTTDGLHYDNATYRKIYDTIENELGE